MKLPSPLKILCLFGFVITIWKISCLCLLILAEVSFWSFHWFPLTKLPFNYLMFSTHFYIFLLTTSICWSVLNTSAYSHYIFVPCPVREGNSVFLVPAWGQESEQEFRNLILPQGIPVSSSCNSGQEIHLSTGFSQDYLWNYFEISK